MFTVGERQLLERCRDGEAAAWNELVERFARYVFAIATRAFGLSEHDAEDVFQEVFARTYAHVGALHDEAAIRPWIAQLTRRLAVDRLRATGRETLTDSPPELMTAGEELARIDLALDVHDAMRRMPDECYVILERFFARDQSYQTIAAELEIPIGTVASRISRCMDKLRAELGSEFGPRPA